MIILNLLIIVLLLSAVEALACDCSVPVGTDREKAAFHFKEASAVFSAKVVGFEYRKDIRDSFGEERKESDPTISYEVRFVKVEVIEWWKQAVPFIVYLRTSYARYSDGTVSESSCTFPYVVGKTYLLFVKDWEGMLSTSDCLGSMELKDADNIRPYLGAGQKTRPQK